MGAGTGNCPGYPTFGAGGRAAPEGVPDPELVEQAKRRSFTAKYKLEILAKADACTRPGEVGELLRREGLYTSHLTYWRKQVRDGALKELGQSARAQAGRPPRRGDRRADVGGPSVRRRSLRRRSESSRFREIVSALLEQMLGTESASGSTER